MGENPVIKLHYGSQARFNFYRQ